MSNEELNVIKARPGGHFDNDYTHELEKRSAEVDTAADEVIADYLVDAYNRHVYYVAPTDDYLEAVVLEAAKRLREKKDA